MRPITFHIGASKCGSSAIQQALTLHPVLPRKDGGTVNYAVLTRAGRLLAGSRIAPRARDRYLKTAKAAELLSMSDEEMEELRAGLDALDAPVLSSEGWMRSINDAQAFLARLDRPVDVVAYVRPQVDYLNSCWWQFDAWTATPRKQWIARRTRASRYGETLRHWQAFPQVRSVTARLMAGDVVSDFLGFMGVRPEHVPSLPRINQSLPAPALRLMQAHPRIAGTLAVETAFTIGALLAGRGLAPTPWVVDPDLAAQVIREARDDNLVLREFLDAPSQAAMDADRRWWDPSVYADRPVEPLVAPPDPAATEALAACLIEALVVGESDRQPRPAGQPAPRSITP